MDQLCLIQDKDKEIIIKAKNKTLQLPILHSNNQLIKDIIQYCKIMPMKNIN